MKTTISVTVDVENYINAKRKVENLSDYVNGCLKSLCDSETLIDGEDSEAKLLALDNTIMDAKIKRDILSMEIQQKKELAAEDAKNRKEFDRWVCPVCQHKNPLDSVRCSGCNLPTRNDKKTVIINTQE